ncbi:MAG: alpha/beta hydrolase, partial [Actinobacteria bacterium]|nr:alpha/beta hydrolase [Actinomycetota bacterium]NIX19962.1 alpha/beta hydrolase [Actinomycetota bacterium]
TVHGIGAPVLLIHGKEDAVVPVESARWLADERPDWDFHVLAGIGHVPQLEAPLAVIDLINAWQRQHAVTAPRAT